MSEFCESCKRPLTDIEMDNEDRNLAKFCHECLYECIDQMVARGEIDRTPDNKISLTVKGVKRALKEIPDVKGRKHAEKFLAKEEAKNKTRRK